MAQWIWRFGEFEIYHNSVVHSKRQAYGYHEPPIWKICRPEPVVEFRKKINTKGGKIHIRACGDFSAALMDVANEREPQYFGAPEIELPAGEHVLDVRVMNFETFPALYIDGIVETDTSWEADDMTLDYRPAAAWDAFDSPEKRPDIFPFRYETLEVQIREVIPEGGVLFDFGRVTFAKVHLSNLTQGQQFRIRYGESREEAMSPEWCVTRFIAEPENGKKEFPPYAFRYIYVSDPAADIRAEYEYLPMAQQGEFRCDDELLNRVWDVAAYTFHLNCREMFLDGYSDHVKEKIFPYAVILGDSIINVGSEPYVKMDICTATSYVAFLVNDEMIGKTEEEKAELSKQWNITFLNYCFSKIGWTVPESFYLYSNEEYGLRENWWIPVAGATEDSEPAPLDVVWERGYPQGTWTWQFAEDWTAPNEYGYSVASSRASYLEQFIDFLFSTPQEVIDEAIANHEKLRHAHDVLDNALKEDFGIDYRLIGYTIKE